MLSRDNIQRVRRDEAAAKAKEDELQQRAALAVSGSDISWLVLWSIDHVQLKLMCNPAGEGSTTDSDA